METDTDSQGVHPCEMEYYGSAEARQCLKLSEANFDLRSKLAIMESKCATLTAEIVDLLDIIHDLKSK